MLLFCLCVCFHFEASLINWFVSKLCMILMRFFNMFPRFPFSSKFSVCGLCYSLLHNLHECVCVFAKFREEKGVRREKFCVKRETSNWITKSFISVFVNFFFWDLELFIVLMLLIWSVKMFSSLGYFAFFFVLAWSLDIALHSANRKNIFKILFYHFFCSCCQRL